MVFPCQVIDIAIDLEFPVFRGHFCRSFPDDMLVVTAAIVLQIMDRNEGQVMRAGQFPKCLGMHDFTAFIEDFAAHTDLFQAGQPQEVQCGFCMAVAHEYAAFYACQGEYMARTGKSSAEMESVAAFWMVRARSSA